MKKLLLALAIVLALAAGLTRAVAETAAPRPAPGFTIGGAKGRSLRNFRGQPVVLLYGRTARGKAFRDQLYRLQEMYSQFAQEKVIFIAAIGNGPADVKSNIPFAIADNGAQIAADYGMTGKFGIAVIGRDGNLDMITDKVVRAERVRDAVFNNFQTQSAERKNVGL